MSEREVEAALERLDRIAAWPDENMATARELHYDFRGWVAEDVAVLRAAVGGVSIQRPRLAG